MIQVDKVCQLMPLPLIKLQERLPVLVIDCLGTNDFLIEKSYPLSFPCNLSVVLFSQVLVVLFLQNSFILALGKANVKCAQSCIGGRQNLREYLFCLYLLVGFDTLIYLRRLQTIPYTCELSRTFSGAVAGEQQRGVNILVCACLLYH